MVDISAYIAQKLIAYAAAHGAEATRAMARPWGLTEAQVNTFCRENSVAIKRARLAMSASNTSARTADAASRATTGKGPRHGVS